VQYTLTSAIIVPKGSFGRFHLKTSFGRFLHCYTYHQRLTKEPCIVSMTRAKKKAKIRRSLASVLHQGRFSLRWPLWQVFSTLTVIPGTTIFGLVYLIHG
jgi:hypothetical protein